MLELKIIINYVFKKYRDFEFYVRKPSQNFDIGATKSVKVSGMKKNQLEDYFTLLQNLVCAILKAG